MANILNLFMCLQLVMKNVFTKAKTHVTVFEKTFFTDKKKAIVCNYQATFDAQMVNQGLQNYARLSTKASMDVASLLAYITMPNFRDGK